MYTATWRGRVRVSASDIVSGKLLATVGVAAMLLWASQASAGEVRVAVAANFVGTLQQLRPEFEAASGHTVIISSGSTGRHYAQIINGAPFDVFLAADTERPQRLLAEGLATQVFSYAEGRLFLWHPEPADNVDMRGWLAAADFGRLAIANPRLAPYGRAAMETLQSLGVAEQLAGQLVSGENVAQCFQFVASGNAAAGFISYAQATAAGIAANGWLVPADTHSPIVQSGAQLTNQAAARDFVVFLRSERARAIIEANGYQLPAD